MTKRRLTVSEAADALGISQDAVRMRVKRGTLEAERDGRQVFVLLDSVGSGVGSQPESEALISEMRGRIEDLRVQLEAERQAHAEARRLLMAALERIPPALEAPETPTEATEEPERGAARGEAQEPSEVLGGPGSGTARGSWWARIFGR